MEALRVRPDKAQAVTLGPLMARSSDSPGGLAGDASTHEFLERGLNHILLNAIIRPA